MKFICISRALFLLTLSFFVNSIVTAAVGDLDLTFNSNGYNIKNFGDSSEEIHASAIQSDGKIVAVGKSGAYVAIVRYNANGSHDTTFNGTGKVVTGILSTADSAHDVSIRPDGKILVAGYSDYSIVVMIRYLSNGSLDTSFGTAGVVHNTFPASVSIPIRAFKILSDGRVMVASTDISSTLRLARFTSAGALDTSFGTGGVASAPGFGNTTDIEVQPDGKIIVAGVTATGYKDFAVARFNSTGSLDTTFDSDGVAEIAFGPYDDVPFDVAVQPDGKILIAGLKEIVHLGDSDFAVARLNSNGSLDPYFGFFGKTTSSFSSQGDIARSIKLQPDGKIVLGGIGNLAFALARLDTSGFLDSTFDGDGKLTTTFPGTTGNTIRSIAIQADGRILGLGASPESSNSRNFATVRYNSNGSIDTSFDGDGIVFTNSVTGSSSLADIKQQSDGKIVGTGWVNWNGDRDFVITRYTSAGAIDTLFGIGGFNWVSFSSYSKDTANAMAIQNDGKIVVVGDSFLGTTSQFAVARLISAGSPDTTFDADGKVLLSLGTSAEANAVAVQSDGKILVGGTALTGGLSGVYRSVIARLKTNGNLDTTYGSGGTVTIGGGDFDSVVYSLAIQPSTGKVIAAGYEDGNFAVARINTNGTLDTSFGTAGKVLIPVAADIDDYDQATSVVLQSDGKIVIGGHVNDVAFPYEGGFALARLTASGNLDTSFNSDGKVVTLIPPAITPRLSKIVLESSGKIVAVGSTNNNPQKIVIVRYDTNGSLDTGFGTGGILIPDVWLKSEEATTALIQSDQKIVVGGSANAAYSEATDRTLLLARFENDGSARGYQNNPVTLSGKITDANGRPIMNAVVELSGGKLEKPLYAVSNEFGFYQFDSVEAADPYTLTISSKRFVFAEGTRILKLEENTAEVDFVALR